MDLETAMLNTESWQDMFCCVEEKNLQKHYQSCQQNPGHKMFFPAGKLCLEKLKPRCRNQEILGLIKMVSDLTVRLSVKYVSEERPETVPDTNIPYPWSRNKGSNLMRVGNGWITDVLIYDNSSHETCNCKDCRWSPSPKTQFAHIQVRTPRHLVYDKLEGEQTTCHLFFDSGETPDDCPGVVALTNMCGIDMISLGLFEDLTLMTYGIHDLQLAGKLKFVTKIIRYGYFSVVTYTDTDNDAKSDTNKDTGEDTNKDTNVVTDNITMNVLTEGSIVSMISHPHGCAKQIYIDYKVEISNTDVEDNQSHVAWKPCVGFSGTPLFIVGRVPVFPFCGELGVGSP